MGVDSAALIKTLNQTCLNALQSAAGLCLSRTNPSVELEHWLVKLVELPDGDLTRIFRHFDVDTSRLLRDLTKVIDGFRTGNQRTPTLSLKLEQLIRAAWVTASIQYQLRQIRSGILLLALLDDEELGRLARNTSAELAKIKGDLLQPNLMKLVAGSPEDTGPAATEVGSSAGPGQQPAAVTQTPALEQFTINLTERAKKGQIDPVIGREAEVRQIVDILIRRRQNNPILTGEAGVGKTAVVEGLARRIAERDVPPPLKNVVVRTLDLGLLQAGAGVKGEFENRLKQVIAEVKGSPVPIILFIDEAHTMIGAGASAGQGDAANLLKPALARGELRTIAATTWAEYKKYFEKDAALARRFQVVKVEEPSEEVAVRMMRGLTGILEKHHGVRILEEAVNSAVKLSHRYIPARQLPDKSVSLIDTACARVAIGQNAIPPAVEDNRRNIDHLKVEIEIRELARGIEARYTEERGKHAGNGQPFQPSAELAASQAELATKVAELRKLQGESPLMQVSVDSQTIAEVVAGWTGIPVGKMMANEIQTVLNLRSKLEERVIGQSHALEAIGQRVRTARASLTDPRRPIGVFLFVGSSGVGKTETALALADTLYGGERNLITINMSEYQESHTVSGLKGSPPGYVGYGEGGVLTEAVRRRPYSVVLLDEVEKAHPDVLELFFQVFDKGHMEDGEGREIDFKNTIIILTTNAGTDTMTKLCADPETMPGPEGLLKALKPELNKIFKPAFLGRMVLIPYLPIRDENLKQIIRLKLGKIQRRMQENHKIEMTYDAALVQEVANRCTEVESGARNVDNILTNTLLPDISRQLLGRMAANEAMERIHVGIGGNGAFEYR